MDLLNKNHNKFILTPIFSVLRDAVLASSGVGSGIETFPLCDYVTQSVFLKMTGFQEQKMKSVCWELASYDYEYRYDRYTKDRLGECSTYNEKNKIYQDLIKQIKRHSVVAFEISSLDKSKILSEVGTEINEIFSNSNFEIWAQRTFTEYKAIWSSISTNSYSNDEKNMFSDSGTYSLKKMYDNHLYRHRNRVAHNTLSYQQNLPTLQTLVEENYKYENYFLFFSILGLIDKLSIELYSKYLHTVTNSA